jgi:hypothetical protein
VTTGDSDMLRHDKILAFVLAAVADPTFVNEYRNSKDGLDYLSDRWGFTDDDIRYIREYKQPTQPDDSPPTLTMTVWQ